MIEDQLVVCRSSSTSHPVPVVRIIVPDTEGRILILKRKNTSFSEGAWCLPGGKIDYGDTVEKTILKELIEETSLECTAWKFLFWQNSLPTPKTTMHCINLYFECQVSGSIVLSEESSEYAWIGSDDLSRYDIAFRNDLGMRQYWRESTNHHQQAGYACSE